MEFRYPTDVSANAGMRMLDLAAATPRVKDRQGRDAVVANMWAMLTHDQRARPDWWTEYDINNDALAGLIADYLLAHRRR